MDVSGSLAHRVAASIPQPCSGHGVPIYRRGGVTCPQMAQSDNLRVVRCCGAAVRQNDADTLVRIAAHDVDWQPTVAAAPSLHGRHPRFRA
jgi:hypothetical protein